MLFLAGAAVLAGWLPVSAEPRGEGRSDRTKFGGLKYDCCTAVYALHTNQQTNITTENDKMAGVVLVWCGAARLLGQGREEEGGSAKRGGVGCAVVPSGAESF